MKRRTRFSVLAIGIILAVLIPSAVFGSGSTEESTDSSSSPYYFSFAYGMWDLARGRIPVEEQPDSPYFQYVAETTGAAPLTVSWEWDGSEGYVRGLRLMLASGDIPEALKPYNTQLTKELIDEGVALPLDDLLEELGQDILALLSDEEWDAVRAQSPDGKIYFIPEINGEDRYPVSLIRKDWLDQAGLPVPSTRDEYVAALRTFRDMDIGGAGSVIPMSGRNGMRWLDDMFMMHGVSMFEGFPQWSWDEESRQLVSEQVSPAMKRSIEFLHYLYQEQLIDPVFMIQSAADWIAKINSGRTGEYFHLPSTLEIFSGFMAEDPDAEWAYMPPLEVPGLEQQQFMFQRAAVPGLMITTAAEDPAKIIAWYNWAMTDEGSMYNWLGIPGVDWTREEDGTIEVLRTDSKPFYSYIPTVTKYIADATRLTPMGETKVEIINQARGNFYYGPDNLGMPDSVYEGHEDFSPQNATLYREWCTKMVTGEIDLSRWDEYVETWYANGGQVVTDRATAWYIDKAGIE